MTPPEGLLHAVQGQNLKLEASRTDDVDAAPIFHIVLLIYCSFKLLATEVLLLARNPQHICTNLSSFTDGPERNIASRTGMREQINVVRQSYS